MEPRAKQDTVLLPIDERMAATIDNLFEVLHRDLRDVYLLARTSDLRLEWSLGGDPSTTTTATTLQAIPGAVVVEFDAAPLYDETTRLVDVRVQFMASVTSGTGYARLYNRTLTQYVGEEMPFTNTAAALITGPALDLPLLRYPYELHVRAAAAIDAPLVWGAKLVTH